MNDAIAATEMADVVDAHVLGAYYVSSFKTLFAGVRRVLDEVQLHFSPEGLFLRQLDPTKTVLVEIAVPKAFFHRYLFLPPDYDVDAAVSSEALYKALRRAKNELRIKVVQREATRDLIVECAGYSAKLEPAVKTENIPPPLLEAAVTIKARVDALRRALLTVAARRVVLRFDEAEESLCIISTRDTGIEETKLRKGSGLLSVSVSQAEHENTEGKGCSRLSSASYKTGVLLDLLGFARNHSCVTVRFSTDASLVLETGMANLFLSPVLGRS